jgi:hypothetical protein
MTKTVRRQLLKAFGGMLVFLYKIMTRPDNVKTGGGRIYIWVYFYQLHTRKL